MDPTDYEGEFGKDEIFFGRGKDQHHLGQSNETVIKGKDFTVTDCEFMRTGEHRIIVSDEHGTNLVVSTFGATITNFWVKDETTEVGRKDIVLGHDMMGEY